MNNEPQYLILEITGVFVILVLPPLIAYSVRKRRKPESRFWPMPIVIAVVISWLFRIFYRIRVELPLNIQNARSSGDIEYDGVGGNVAVLMMGWVEPLIACLIFVGILKIFAYFKSIKNV